MDYSELPQRLDAINARIAAAAARSGRKREDISLVAISKYQPAEAIAALAEHGHADFGENYVQEASEKLEALQHLDLRWHFTGMVQTKKAKYVVGPYHLLQTVGTEKLAQALHKQAQKRDMRQKILIQVNIGDEPQKSGVTKGELKQLAGLVEELDGLELTGLMCMPPFFDTPEKSRPYFAALRQCKVELDTFLGRDLQHLSMGMSMDFELAVEEGATIVRVGTDIFGPRPCNI